MLNDKDIVENGLGKKLAWKGSGDKLDTKNGNFKIICEAQSFLHLNPPHPTLQVSCIFRWLFFSQTDSHSGFMFSVINRSGVRSESGSVAKARPLT